MVDSVHGFALRRVNDSCAVLTLSTALYRPRAIQKAAYRLADRFSLALDAPGPETVAATLTSTTGRLTDDDLAIFERELLDQELREVVAQESEAVRNVLLAQVFASTSLVQGGADAADYRQDPLGITREGRRETA